MTVELGVVPCAVAVFVKMPGLADAITGPTTQTVTLPGARGSVNAHEAVDTFASVTLIDERAMPPVFEIVNRYQTFDPAATVIAEDHGPADAALISLSRLNPAGAPRYQAEFGLDGTAVPTNEAPAVAVFGCDPAAAAIDVGDPAMQETVAPGAREAGQEHKAGSTAVPARVGSVTPRPVSVASPEL